MDKPMNQRYHVVFTKDKRDKSPSITVRRPWKGPGVELYSSSGKWDKEGKMLYPAMFGKHEERQFLEELGPFIVVSVAEDVSELVKGLVDDGYIVTDPSTQVKSQWYTAGYFVRDEGTTLIMLPEKTTDEQFFKRLGLHVDLQGKKNNCFKIGKYMKRLYSHHKQIIRGTVVSTDMDKPVIVVKLDNGKTILVKYADHGKLTDGMNLVSSHCMKMLGLKGTAGGGLRITALSPKGFSKGHAIVLDDLQFDLVLFNSKKLLYGDRFILAVDWLHSGKLCTDVQSVVNFQMYRNPCLKLWSQQFMEEVLDALPDQAKLRKMLQFYKVEFHRNKVGEQKGEFIDKEKDWSLLRAMRGGVDHRPHPALVRKIFHLFIDKIMDCERDIRIPVPATAGDAKYAMVDPTIFDCKGEPVLEGQLHGNTVYADAFAGDVAFHRQPNGHRGEHCIAEAVPNGILEKMDTGCFIFLSKDTVAASLDALGGGDQDDRLVYYKDQSVVEHFMMLDTYPGQKPIKKPEAEEGFNPFGHHLFKAKYDRTALFTMLDMQKKQRVHIGQAVNPLIHDAILSDNKDFMIAYLTELMSKDPKNDTQKNRDALKWMIEYAPYRLSKLAWDLETVIDAVKKDGSDVGDYAAIVKAANADMQVVARFNTKGGKYKGRVPSSRRGNNHPVIVDTPVDVVLDEIAQIRAMCEDTACEISWQMLQPVPEEILTQPTMPFSQDLAQAIRRYYGQLWAEANVGEQVSRDKEEIKKRIDLYVKIDEMVFNRFCDNPLIVDAFVWLYQIVYNGAMRFEAPRNKEGRPESFHDGLLWGPRCSAFTMQALELCGLAGRYTEIPDEQWMSKQDRKQYGHKDVDVVIENGVVTVDGTDRQIAMMDTWADGTTKVEHGMVFIPARNAYAYEPEPKLATLCVVAGLQERHATTEEILKWKSHVHEHVTLQPYLYEGEHAVHVILDDGSEYGNIATRDGDHNLITNETEGWLLPGDAYTMQVCVKG